MMRFKQDVSRALRVYNTELYRPLSVKDEGYRAKAEKGIYISEDGMCYIMKRSQSNHYYFVKWLAYADFLTLLKKNDTLILTLDEIIVHKSGTL